MARTKPTTFEELKQYALRKCGSPVIDINIADEQLDDAIGDALDFFKEYHVDAKTMQYMKHAVTQAEIDARKMTLPENVIAVTNVFNPQNGGTSAAAMFDITYQIQANEIWDSSSLDMTYYYLTQEYISFVQDMITTNIRYDFNPASHQLSLHTEMDRFVDGSVVLLEVYTELDPDVSTSLWGHWVLRDLAAAEVKKQWGANLIKFQDVKLPGGSTLNGEKIYQQATNEIEKIKEDFILKYQEPDELIIR